MKLYFWDWHDSLRVQRVDMDMPWRTEDEARRQDCYTKLSEAVLAGKADLLERIKEAEQQIKELNHAYTLLDRTDVHTVEKLDYDITLHRPYENVDALRSRIFWDW